MGNNTSDMRNKIVNTLKSKGPSLPVQIARETQISSLFAGAFLSELAEEKIVKISQMKVGGSPLYFIKGQESSLEKFYNYLPSKEKEAFLLLKEKNILQDKNQLPAIRVALRNLKDFAYPFLKDNEVFWRFHSVNEEQVREMLEPEKEPEKEIQKSKEKEKPQEQKITETKKQETAVKEKARVQTKLKTKETKKDQLDIGLKKQVETKTPAKKPKEKPEFALKMIEILKNSNIELLEEIDSKKREFSAIIRIRSELGKIKFLCIAKDKKKITENDLRLVVEKSQTLKMPSLVLFPQEVNKKALEYAEACPLLKLKKIQ